MDFSPPDAWLDFASSIVMYLSLARGFERFAVKLPSHLIGIGKQRILEVRLVFNKSTFRYS